jgi:RNA polymerase sigma-70 factor, ECF subfamily
MLRTLRAAVARACPAERSSSREDLVQSALVRVIEREQADEKNTVRTASYLWRVAFTAAADELRRRRSEDRKSERADMQPGQLSEATSPGPELALAIRDCLARLAEPRRLAVLLHLQGFRAEEAERVLRWNLKRVQNLTYRGLADLRECLDGKGLSR